MYLIVFNWILCWAALAEIQGCENWHPPALPLASSQHGVVNIGEGTLLRVEDIALVFSGWISTDSVPTD